MAFTVNGELVEDSAVREEVRAMRPRYESVARGMDPMEAEAQLRAWSGENVIERVLLRQDAVSDPAPIPAEAIEEQLQQTPADTREDVELRLKIERLVSRVTGKIAKPKHKEISEYYRKTRSRFFRPEQVRAAHIFQVVDEKIDEAAGRAAIEQVQQEIREGASFEDRANDMGFVPRGHLPREFEELLFSLADGQMSDIFRSRAGFHIAKVYERKPEGISAFPEVEQAIEEALHQRKRERAIE